MSPTDVGFQLEPHDGEVANVVRTEGWKKYTLFHFFLESLHQGFSKFGSRPRLPKPVHMHLICGTVEAFGRDQKTNDNITGEGYLIIFSKWDLEM